MARERITLDVFELAELLDEFLAEGSIEIGGVQIASDDEERGGNWIVSKMFAEYAMQRNREGGYIPTPLGAVFDFGFLLHMAKKGEYPGAIASYEKKYRVALKEFPEIITEEQSEIIESFLSKCQAYEAQQRRVDDVAIGIEAHLKSRRAEASAAISAPKLRILIMERDGAKCKWCGETEGLAIDHILPVVAGGTDDPENLQVLCGSCNSSKGDRVPSQFKEGV